MASAFSHAVAAAALGTAFARPASPARFWVIGMACSVLPDADVLGFALGIEYGSLLGHRGLTHSLAFAALVATVAARLCNGPAPADGRVYRGWWYFFLATASHGVLDAMTNGGLGVAFFSPFSNTRYFFPWRPIVVSPIGITSFLSERGIRVLRSEFLWVWLPAAVFAGGVLAFKFSRRAGKVRNDTV